MIELSSYCVKKKVKNKAKEGGKQKNNKESKTILYRYIALIAALHNH